MIRFTEIQVGCVSVGRDPIDCELIGTIQLIVILSIVIQLILIQAIGT